jgi:hypothetical protein
VTVDVRDARAARARGIDRVAADALRHPRHRHPADERAAGALEELARARVLVGEALALGAVDGRDALAVDVGGRGHGASLAVVAFA